MSNPVTPLSTRIRPCFLGGKSKNSNHYDCCFLSAGDRTYAPYFGALRTATFLSVRELALKTYIQKPGAHSDSVPAFALRLLLKGKVF